jgi:hypothetical protein
MDETASKAFFLEDVKKLENISSELGIYNPRTLGEKQVLFKFRWKNKTYAVLIKGGSDYPLSPTSIRFVNPENTSDDSVANWPVGVNAINSAERFVCILGSLEGHKRHPEWQQRQEKNRIPDLAFRFIGLFGEIEGYEEQSQT